MKCFLTFKVGFTFIVNLFNTGLVAFTFASVNCVSVTTLAGYGPSNEPTWRCVSSPGKVTQTAGN